MSSRRKIRLYAFMSSKGGVGKSTLAVTTGRLIASLPGREAAVLDLDMWGSSLGDALALRAPVVPQADGGRLRLDAPATGELMSRDQTVAARLRRANTHVERGDEPVYLAYLNDALFAAKDGDRLAVPVDHFLWRAEATEDGALAYIPSSPLLDDVSRVAAWLSEEQDLERWAANVWWLILSLIEQRPGLTDVVCDLSPGLVGLNVPFRFLIGAHAKGEPQPKGFPAPAADWEIEVLPYFVTTPDRQALASTAEAFIMLRQDLPGLQLVVNRAETDMGAIEATLAAHFRPLYGVDPFRVDRHAQLLDEREELRTIFRDGGSDGVPTRGMGQLRRLLRLEEGT